MLSRSVARVALARRFGKFGSATMASKPTSASTTINSKSENPAAFGGRDDMSGYVRLGPSPGRQLIALLRQNADLGVLALAAHHRIGA